MAIGGLGVITSFNLEARKLSVAAEKKVTIYSLSESGSELKHIEAFELDDVYIMERLGTSAILMYVSEDDRHLLRVFHIKYKDQTYKLRLPDPILCVKINRMCLAISSVDSIAIYNPTKFSLRLTIKQAPNPLGVMALSAIQKDELNYLAYPCVHEPGNLCVLNVNELKNKCVIEAHTSPIAAIAFDSTAMRVATASEHGTVIRVFSTDSGAKLSELRRGIARCVIISSLAFSSCGDYLVTGSNTETIHVFDVATKSEEEKQPKSWLNYVGETMSKYLPTNERAMACATLDGPGKEPHCAITKFQDKLRLLVASNDGYLYVYSVPEKGTTQCQLVVKHDLCSKRRRNAAKYVVLNIDEEWNEIEKDELFDIKQLEHDDKNEVSQGGINGVNLLDEESEDEGGNIELQLDKVQQDASIGNVEYSLLDVDSDS